MSEAGWKSIITYAENRNKTSTDRSDNKLIDQRCSLQRDPKHSRNTACRLTRAIHASLQDDRRICTEIAGAAISSTLNGKNSNLHQGYNIP